jgi:hypothetical protein
MNRKSKFTQSVTALYCRLSIEDGRENESMSISNQENICQGGFHRKDEIPDKQELFSLFEFFDCKLISFLNQRF